MTMIAKSDSCGAPFSRSFVGIFWAVQEKGRAASLLEHRCSLKEAEPYGEMLTCPHGHYEVWEQWQKDAKLVRAGFASPVMISEYEEWPRGRIVKPAQGELHALR